MLGDSVAGKMPWVPGAGAISKDPVQLIANSTWQATLAVTGADGLPPVSSAGNVLLPQLAFKLSLRLPPTCDSARAAAAVKQALEHDPPYAARVEFEYDPPADGWNAPSMMSWLEQSINRASETVYGKEAAPNRMRRHHSVHGNVRKADFHAPSSLSPVCLAHIPNAHGPTEFLELEYAKQLTACVSIVLIDHARTLRP